MKRFGTKVWDTRLQVIWICFAATYQKVAEAAATMELATLRIVSTSFVIVSGALLFLMVVHTLRHSDSEKAEKSLMVALGASLFCLNASLKMRDPLAPYLAFTFTLLLVWFCWLGNAEVEKRRLVLVEVGTVLVGCVVCGLLGFAFTLIAKQSTFLRPSLLIAPVSTATFGAFVGLLMAGFTMRVGSGLLVTPPRRQVVIFRTLLGTIFVTFLAAVSGKARLVHEWHVNPERAVIIAGCLGLLISLLLGVLPSLGQYKRIHRLLGLGGTEKIPPTSLLIVLGGVLYGPLGAAIMALVSPNEVVLTRHLVTEGVTGLLIAIGLSLAVKLMECSVMDRLCAPAPGQAGSASEPNSSTTP